MSGPPRDLRSWLAYQERINPAGIDLGLQRLRAVAERMDLADPRMPLVTVAGTNGKGSTVACLEALALAHGVRPGCYLSPHLLRYNECVRIGGEAVGDAELVAAFQRVEDARGEEALTAFEHRTLAAVDLIRRSGAGMMVLEVGLGGRLDAVNLLDADVSVITAIGLDHREWLGDTLEQVAAEKAGVMRAGRPVVLSDPGSVALLAPLARAAGARTLLPGEHYRFGAGNGGWWFRAPGVCLDALPLPRLPGRHQLVNAAGALAAFHAMESLPPVTAEGAISALSRAGEPGRLQRVRARGACWVDVAHNPLATGALATFFAGGPPLRAVCAMNADKDLPGSLRPLVPLVRQWYLADLPGPRGADAAQLAAALRSLAPHAPARRFAAVTEAWRAARADAAPREPVLAFGSFETARQVLLLESAGPTPKT